MLRLRYERQQRGWNQTVVAFRAKMSISDISRIETGRMRPYPDQLKRLGKLFGVDGEALLEELKLPQSAA
jgi:transcriptional regulator with XRE-family HTH domain